MVRMVSWKICLLSMLADTIMPVLDILVTVRALCFLLREVWMKILVFFIRNW